MALSGFSLEPNAVAHLEFGEMLSIPRFLTVAAR